MSRKSETLRDKTTGKETKACSFFTHAQLLTCSSQQWWNSTSFKSQKKKKKKKNTKQIAHLSSQLSSFQSSFRAHDLSHFVHEEFSRFQMAQTQINATLCLCTLLQSTTPRRTADFSHAVCKVSHRAASVSYEISKSLSVVSLPGARCCAKILPALEC